MKSCFFIGYREASEELRPALIQAVKKHITGFGVTEFIVGHYGNFDRMAAQAVIAAKKAIPGNQTFHVNPLPPSRTPH